MNIEFPGMVSIQFLSIPSGASGPGKKIDPSPFAFASYTGIRAFA